MMLLAVPLAWRHVREQRWQLLACALLPIAFVALAFAYLAQYQP